MDTRQVIELLDELEFEIGKLENTRDHETLGAIEDRLGAIRAKVYAKRIWDCIIRDVQSGEHIGRFATPDEARDYLEKNLTRPDHEWVDKQRWQYHRKNHYGLVTYVIDYIPPIAESVE